jgi:hypothetical protein
LRRDVDELWIHSGVYPWGGGNDSILIHTGQGQIYIDQKCLDETLFHEATHTSVDAEMYKLSAWKQAV